MKSHSNASPPNTARRQVAGRGRGVSLALLLLIALLISSFAPSIAGAARYQRPFEGALGSTEQPSLESGAVIAVEPGTNDVLVAEPHGVYQPTTIQRFHPNGTPAPFSALGGNEIDGKAGPGGKPCAEEPASCDRTPEGNLLISEGGAGTQIAIDNSGGATDGNIYITQYVAGVVDIFSSEGKYLGQLTASGSTQLRNSCGVAVDSNGTVYVGAQFSAGSGRPGIVKYDPSGSAPVNADSVARWSIEFPEPLGGTERVCHLALGTHSSAGAIFASVPINMGSYHEYLTVKVNAATGAYSVFANGFSTLIGVDPTTGNVLAEDKTLATTWPPETIWEAAEFNGSKETAGPELSRLVVEGEPVSMGARDFAFDETGAVYVTYSRLGAESTRILKYGQPKIVPTVEVDSPTGVTGSRAVLSGALSASGVAVSDCFFEYAPVNADGHVSWEHAVPCEGSISTGPDPHPVRAKISGLEPDGKRYSFRLVATNENGTERSPSREFGTAHTAATEAATDVGRATATLHGTILPEGLEYSQCVFEWGFNGEPFEHKTSCTPPAATIEPIFSPQPVSADLGGLRENTTYHFRLAATNAAGAQVGKEQQFTTLGSPQLSEVRASFASQSSVRLEAKVNPSGFGTAYHFEWGTSANYGNSTPAGFELFAGSGTTPVGGTVKLTGLAPGTVYHYRVVATSSAGTEFGADKSFETLGRCGLPEQRCYELVSPRDLGPVAAPGRSSGSNELRAQAASSGPSALAYTVEGGLPDATRGAEALYLGKRTPGGWASGQFSPPIVGPDEKYSAASNPSYVKGLAPDLSCGIVASSQPLTSDPRARLVIEAGGGNLYRRDADGSYDLITYLPPINLPNVKSDFLFLNYEVIAVSRDCQRVIFESDLHYAGIEGVGEWRMYEWHDGTLSTVAVVPDGSGESVTEIERAAGSHLNALSNDGSRLFFVARRLAAPLSGEVGGYGVFARDGQGGAVDVSASETNTPDTGAEYQGATADGSHVYFVANAGLVTETSSEGTDLYEYDFTKPEGERLTDLSVSSEPGGVELGGLVGFAEDGSRVYFAARAELLPGKGSTREDNVKSKTWSIYETSNGAVHFVGTMNDSDLGGRGGAIAALGSLGGDQRGWTSRVSANGRFLLFQSSADVIGYQSDGMLEAYIYDALNETTACVSCRQDGAPPKAQVKQKPVLEANSQNWLSAPQSLTLSGGRPRVFFTSAERLASGGVQGAFNLYEWIDGQVFHIATEPVGAAAEAANQQITFVGASADGSDLYFFDAAALNWENPEGRNAVWDAKVGGGFAEPPAPPRGCDPASEGSCQAPFSPSPASPGPASANVHGAGNVRPATKHRRHIRKRHKRRADGRRHKRIKKHKQGRRARHANGNRRAGK